MYPSRQAIPTVAKRTRKCCFKDLDKIPSQSADSHASTIIFQIEKASVFFKFGLSLESLVTAFSLSLDSFLLTVDSSLTV